MIYGKRKGKYGRKSYRRRSVGSKRRFNGGKRRYGARRSYGRRGRRPVVVKRSRGSTSAATRARRAISGGRATPGGEGWLAWLMRQGPDVVKALQDAQERGRNPGWLNDKELKLLKSLIPSETGQWISSAADSFVDLTSNFGAE